MGAKSNDKCTYKRHTENRRGGGNVRTEAEIGCMLPQTKRPRNADTCQKLEEADVLLLYYYWRDHSLQCPVVDFWPSEL